MNVKHIYELPCYDSRKSFYGKAHVIEDDAGNVYLRSYETIVCYIDAGGAFHRVWSGYSMTTQRHINSFMYEYGISPRRRGKSAWDKMPIEEDVQNENLC